MNSSQYKKSQLKYLASIIGSSPEEIEYIVSNIDDYYNEWFEKKVDKNTGEYKTYKDGTIKRRAIRPPLKRLKALQTSIRKKILSKIILPTNIQGGVKKKSNITNAKKHQGNKFQFTTDLEAFFPNINHKQIYKMFLNLGYSNHIAGWLTKLCTWKYELPQGTTLSTQIANLVFLETDNILISLSEENGLTYTRYVDDLTFSAQSSFKELINPILDIVKTHGFKINYRKTFYQGRQIITGIQVNNNYISAPEKIKAKTSAEIGNDIKDGPYAVYIANIKKTNKGLKKKTT